MPIVFSCSCGRPLRAKEEMAGKKTKCPHCGAIQTIPTSAAKATAAVTSHPDALPVEDLAWPGTDPGSSVPGGTTLDIAQTGGLNPPSSTEPVRPSELPKPSDGTPQYKVLSQKDHSASGKLNFLRLEEVLNEHAKHGWVVKSSFVIDVPGHAGHHDELVLILER